MILGIGNDIVDIARIEEMLESHGERFLERCFTQIERDLATSRSEKGQSAQTLALRYAAKEACAKALGSGFRDGVILRDIGIENDEVGKPVLHLTGGALEALNALCPDGHHPVCHVSLSDEPPYAQAFVILEARAS